MPSLLNLPIMDWEHAISVAGNKREHAEKIFQLLIKELKQEREKINYCYAIQDFEKLRELVHKLHGGLAYSGLIRLKTIVRELETNLKNNIMNSLPLIIATFDNEVDLLLEQYSHLN